MGENPNPGLSESKPLPPLLLASVSTASTAEATVWSEGRGGVSVVVIVVSLLAPFNRTQEGFC